MTVNYPLINIKKIIIVTLSYRETSIVKHPFKKKLEKAFTRHIHSIV